MKKKNGVCSSLIVLLRFVKKLTQMYHQILIVVGDNDFINVKSHRYMYEIEATISFEPKAKKTYFK